MRKLLILFAGLLMLVPSVGWAQLNTNTLPPECAMASLVAGSCVPLRQGVRARASGASAADCETAGVAVPTCEYDGTTWQVVTSGVIGFGTNGESIVNTPDGTFDFTRDEAGVVTITASDDDAVAALTVLPGGAAAMILGGATTTTLNLTNNGAMTLGAATTDSVAINAAGVVTIGNGTTTGVEIDTEGLDVDIDVNNPNTISLENTTTGSVVLDFRDYADTTDDDQPHVALAANCTTATTGAEDCDLIIQATEIGVVETRVTIDGDGDIVFAPERPDGGNGDGLTTNPQRRINGIPKIAPFAIAAGKVNTNTVSTDFMDETPAGEWTATANVTDATEATVIRMGAGSLSLTYTAAVADTNGADNPLGSGDQDWSADESVGLWHRCDFIYDAGDLYLGVTDNASEDVTTAFPAYGTANTWVWTELEIGSIADADKNIITDISLDVSAAGAITIAAADGGVCYFDYMFKWDAAEENALGLDIYEDGLLSVMSMVTATGGDRTPIIEVEGTDYFIHYEAGVDFFVSITDLSADSLWGLAALE